MLSSEVVTELIWVRKLTLGSSLTIFISAPPEGKWSDVSKAIHDCHAAVHSKGAPRVATDIRIGTRTDREIAHGTGNAHKVKRVEDILAKA